MVRQHGREEWHVDGSRSLLEGHVCSGVPPAPPAGRAGPAAVLEGRDCWPSAACRRCYIRATIQHGR
jgi:hypothetical protein